MPKRLDPGAKQGIMTKTHRQTLDGKKHPSFATQSPRKQTSLISFEAPPIKSRVAPKIGNVGVGQLASPYACLSVSCAAGENARRRISKIATMLVMPDAARIMATMMN